MDDAAEVKRTFDAHAQTVTSIAESLQRLQNAVRQLEETSPQQNFLTRLNIARQAMLHAADACLDVASYGQQLVKTGGEPTPEQTIQKVFSDVAGRLEFLSDNMQEMEQQLGSLTSLFEKIPGTENACRHIAAIRGSLQANDHHYKALSAELQRLGG